jgi:hypothetical protein
MIKRVIFFWALLILMVSCDKETNVEYAKIEISNSLEYSFLVAGHTYGDPDNWVEGLYPLFKSFFPFINSYPKIQLAFLTGDVIPKDEDYRWDFALNDLKSLNVTTHIVPGNHDLGFTIFFDRFGYFFKSFTYNSDIFILLTPSLDHWNISGDQLDFLKRTLEKDGQHARNIFIFHHELLWWSPENKFSGVKINWDKNYPGPNNFEEEILPLFKQLNKPCFFFAGDLGARSYANAYMYYKEANITLIASGMGAGLEDNFIITEVHEDGSVNFQLCAMQGEMNRLGNLKDFILP